MIDYESRRDADDVIGNGKAEGFPVASAAGCDECAAVRG
jgi:hypothetical protein